MMRIFLNTFGTDIRLREETTLEPPSPSLRDVLGVLLEQTPALGRFLRDDLSPVQGVAILVNGRNVRSLEGPATTIHEGDELTFTVMLAGG